LGGNLGTTPWVKGKRERGNNSLASGKNLEPPGRGKKCRSKRLGNARQRGKGINSKVWRLESTYGKTSMKKENTWKAARLEQRGGDKWSRAPVAASEKKEDKNDGAKMGLCGGHLQGGKQHSRSWSSKET